MTKNEIRYEAYRIAMQANRLNEKMSDLVRRQPHNAKLARAYRKGLNRYGRRYNAWLMSGM